MESEANRIRGYIRNEIGYQREIDLNADLIADGIVDSFSIVGLMTFIQANFDIEFEQEDMTVDNVRTLSSLLAFIAGKKKN